MKKYKMRQTSKIKRIIFALMSTVLIVSSMPIGAIAEESSEHEHVWTEATCTAPMTCTVCGTTEGDTVEHSWIEATCTAPKTCSVCGTTDGGTAEHSWVPATCTAPKTCSVCGTTDGGTAEHSWVPATCTAPKTCSVCGFTEGKKAEHSFTNYELYEEATEDNDATERAKCDNCDVYSEPRAIEGTKLAKISLSFDKFTVNGKSSQTGEITLRSDKEGEVTVELNLGNYEYINDSLIVRDTTNTEADPIYPVNVEFNEYVSKNTLKFKFNAVKDKDYFIRVSFTGSGSGYNTINYKVNDAEKDPIENLSYSFSEEKYEGEKITIYIGTDDNKPINGAMVSLSGIADGITTDEEGKVVFTNLKVNEKYSVSVTLPEGYSSSAGDVVGTIQLHESGKDNEPVKYSSFTSAYSKLTVYAKNASLVVLDDVSVTCNEETKTTKDGKPVIFDKLENGKEYTVSFSLEGYTFAEQTITITKDTEIEGIGIAATPTPEATEAPTAEPTTAPTEAPTAKPTSAPTDAPTTEPTAVPTSKPTASPSPVPTAKPSVKPTATPTPEITKTPKPTEAPSTKTITVKIEWDDENNKYSTRPSSVSVNLKKNGEVYKSQKLTEANSWMVIWKDLSKNNTWSLGVQKAPEQYTREQQQVSGTIVLKYILKDEYRTNHPSASPSASPTANPSSSPNVTYDDERSITVEIVWKDNNDKAKKRPKTQTVVLKKDGAQEKLGVISASTNWTITWDKLDSSYKWTLGLFACPSGYTRTYSSTSDKVIITYTYDKNQENTSSYLKVSINWKNDNNSVRPASMMVYVKADGEVIDSKVLNSSNSWSAEWKSLPSDVRWSVAMTTTPHGYTRTNSIVGHIITFTYTYDPTVTPSPAITRTPEPAEIYTPSNPGYNRPTPTPYNGGNTNPGGNGGYSGNHPYNPGYTSPEQDDDPVDDEEISDINDPDDEDEEREEDEASESPSPSPESSEIVEEVNLTETEESSEEENIMIDMSSGDKGLDPEESGKNEAVASEEYDGEMQSNSLAKLLLYALGAIVAAGAISAAVIGFKTYKLKKNSKPKKTDDNDWKNPQNKQ